jgi:hypothetical protein
MKCELCDTESGFYIKETADMLQSNTYMAVHCESCGLSIIGKTLDEETKLGHIIGKAENEQIPIAWVSYEEFTEKHQQIKKEYETHLHE